MKVKPAILFDSSQSEPWLYLYDETTGALIAAMKHDDHKIVHAACLPQVILRRWHAGPVVRGESDSTWWRVVVPQHIQSWFALEGHEVAQ